MLRLLVLFSVDSQFVSLLKEYKEGVKYVKYRHGPKQNPPKSRCRPKPWPLYNVQHDQLYSCIRPFKMAEMPEVSSFDEPPACGSHKRRKVRNSS